MLLKIILAILIFLYLYGPDLYFLPLNIVTIIGLLSFLIISIKYKFVLLQVVKSNFSIFVLLILLIVYSFAIEILNEVPITTNNFSILNIRIFIEAILPSILLSIFLIKRNYDFEKLLKLLIWISAFQIIFIILMFDFNLKYYMMETIMKMPPDSIVFNPQVFFIRIFGLAKNHLFAFPFVQGIFIVFVFIVARLTNNRFYLLLTVPILISIILNARIGLVPIAVYFLLSVFIVKKRMNINRLIIGMFTSIIIILLSLFIFNQLQENEAFKNASQRTYEFVESTKNLFNENDTSETGVFNQLINNHILLPNTISEWIFGTGLKEKSELERSDIGYLRYLNYGGIVYSLLIYSFFIILFYKLYILAKYHDDKKEIRLIAVVFFVSFFLSQMKGEIFTVNESIRLLFLLFIFLQISLKNMEHRHG